MLQLSSANAKRAAVISGDDVTGTQGHGRRVLRECGCVIRSWILCIDVLCDTRVN